MDVYFVYDAKGGFHTFPSEEMASDYYVERAAQTPGDTSLCMGRITRVRVTRITTEI